MKKRIFSLLLTFLAACMVLAGCKKNVGTPEDNAVEEGDKAENEDEEAKDTNYTFGYSCIDMDNPYYETLQLSIEMMLKEREIGLVTKNPGSDVDLQIEQIQQMIDQGVDAVFLCPADREKITPALKALKEADIPVINIDTQVKDIDLTAAFIGSDNKNAGYLCGTDLIKQKPDGGKIVILENPAVNAINERITGFEEAISKGGFEVLARINTGDTQGNIQNKMKEALAKFPHIDAVMCGNDQVALEALKVIEDAGRTDMLVYGVDGSPGVKGKLLEPGTRMAGTGAQSPIDIGKKAVDTAVAIMKGDEYEKETYVDTFFINKDNAEMYGTDGWQ
ncbi:sugar ABC transporter substrate-binding protein [Clostridium sp. C105KSO13]|uniref:sugar ABC transporter substrate-binding protein n=1 Tax=Clostridium sp. C105KSO13 TaxID=1776045 RepID=UPI0007406390|nr:sugar ABC transporter substrate-binding protein [Clostridium sp. C105KSO13]CUX16899.1 D-ribose-binding periplasmic protein precursor [Clostridium sp. C105KSO13]